MVDCYCNSKNLYSNQNSKTNILIDLQSEIYLKNELNPLRVFEYDKMTNKQKKEIQEINDFYQIQYSKEIQEIDFKVIKQNGQDFQKQFVLKNKPVIIKNGIQNWKALKKWNDNEYLKSKLKDEQISIDITKDGFADSIKEKYLVEPYQEKGTFSDFLKLSEESQERGIISYIQKQDNNFEKEFKSLYEDIDSNIKDTFDLIFESNVDAFNLWIGKQQSVSSLHKDHYENIYCVIQGEKHFTLLPPTSYPYLREGEYYQSNLQPINNNKINNYNNNINDNNIINNKNKNSNINNNVKQMFMLKTSNDITRWLSVNVDNASHISQYKLEDIKKYHIILKQGDILYLPSLWYHQVSQYHPNDQFIIACNYWWDMDYSSHHFIFNNYLQSSLAQF